MYQMLRGAKYVSLHNRSTLHHRSTLYPSFFDSFPITAQPQVLYSLLKTLYLKLCASNIKWSFWSAFFPSPNSPLQFVISEDSAFALSADGKRDQQTVWDRCFFINTVAMSVGECLTMTSAHRSALRIGLKMSV